MNVYQIGGLGADERVFQFLNLRIASHVINWIESIQGEGLESYASRLTEQIDIEEKFVLIGVSFGGIIALEISKIVEPEFLILISSVTNHEQLPRKFLALGRTGILNLLPISMIKPPPFLQKYLFSARNTLLLKTIIRDTDPNFIKWALKSMLKWQLEKVPNRVFRIHGTRDRLIPLLGDAIQVENGGHFMIVDNADEVSEIVNGILQEYC